MVNKTKMPDGNVIDMRDASPITAQFLLRMDR
jgi:hypothetical protein